MITLTQRYLGCFALAGLQFPVVRSDQSPQEHAGFFLLYRRSLPTFGIMDSMQVPGQPQQGLQASCVCHHLPPSLSQSKTPAAHVRLIGMQAAQHPTFADFGTGNHGHGMTPNHESCHLCNSLCQLTRFCSIASMVHTCIVLYSSLQKLHSCAELAIPATCREHTTTHIKCVAG